MRVSLTIYLLKSSVKSLDDAFKVCNLDDYHPVDPDHDSLVGISKCYVKSNPSVPPKWVKFYSMGFKIPADSLRNRSSSLVIFVLNSGRVFAVTAGAGHHSVPRDVVESDFGLKAALNAVGVDTLKSLQSRNVDQLTVQRIEVANQKTSLRSFVLDEQRDLLARVEGVPESGVYGVSISGAESLRLQREAECEELPSICGQMLKLSRQKKYKKNFGFVDQVRRVVDVDVLSKLNELLDKRVRQRKYEGKFSLALPSIERYAEITSYSLIKHKTEVADLGDLAVKILFDFTTTLGQGGSVTSEYRVVARNVAGDVVESSNLYDWLVAELPMDGNLYVLTGGVWYAVSKDFVKETNSRVQGISQIKTKNYMPPIRVDSEGNLEKEEDYNKRCVKGGVICLDQKNISMTKWGKVEACDLFTRDRHLIHVKKRSSSSTMSHLWSQGVVSAQLLIESREFRGKLRKKMGSLADLVSLESINPADFTVVYAIASQYEDFPLRLPFFSKVNMVYNCDILSRMGYSVKIRKIEYEAV